MADIERSAQEAVLIGRRKRNPSAEMGSLVAVKTGHNAAGIMLGIGSPDVAVWFAVKRCNKDSNGLIPVKRTRHEARRRNLSGPCRQRRERPYASGKAQPASFGADKVMRAQAIVAIMIAPAIPMVSRQASMGTTRWASPCAA